MDVAAVETIEAGASEVAEDTSFDPDKRIDVEQNQDTDNTSSEYDVDRRIEVTDTSMDSENYDPDKRIDVSENNDKHQAEENEYNPDDRVTFDTFKDSILSKKMGDIYVPEQSNEQIDSENTTFDVDKRIDVNQNEVTDDSSEYDPDKRIGVFDVDDRQNDDGYSPDDRIDVIKDDSSKSAVDKTKVNSEVQKNDYPSTYKDRLDQTPRDDGERGVWTNERGESKFIPNDEEISDILGQYGINGIEYQNAIPDFSDCSECTLEIDNMTEKRRTTGGNFEQCDQKCAEQWNTERKDGKSDWTARDVENWRGENGYTWHERNDMKTCDLIPTKINDYFGHLGGVGECKRRDSQNDFGGEFDE